MHSIDHLQLLEAKTEFERLSDLVDALPHDARSTTRRLLQQHIQHAITEAERIVALAAPTAELMPWWQEWQRKQKPHG
jgi:predicted membrane chloride channel (bestrophin family)